MRWVVRAIATVGGIGYLPKAPGTAGSFVGVVLGLLTTPSFKDPQPYPTMLLLGLVACFFLGMAVSGQLERALGIHDPAIVVIDELWGMWAILVASPMVRVLPLTVIAFVLFRAFDIVKPPPLKRLGRLPGGWGIMLDDLGAAAYALGVLWVVLTVVRSLR